MMLSGKTVLITGAGRGIGRAIALECASQGGNIILLARTHSELANTAAEISRAGGNSLIFVCDISSASKVNKAVSSAKRELGEIDVLVNNAGIQPPIGPFSETDIREWKRNIEINLFGTANVISTVLPGMIARQKGKIINLSGGGSTSPRPNFSAYAISKTALVRFTEILAVELFESHIDVNAISPGAVNTKMLDEVLLAGARAGKEATDAERRRDKGGDDPELAATLVCYLASDESDGITGKLISARWDPWRELSFREKLRSDKDFATLRRIDDNYYAKR